jgi:hypothetical protein
MKIVAYILTVACAIVAALYFTLPGGALPRFIPGYVAGSTHVHVMHGVAAVAAGIFFLLVGLSVRPK